MIFLQLRSGNSGPAFQGENQNDTLLWDTTERKFFVGPSSGAGVTSWNGRTGVVVPQSGDYDSDEVDNASTVAGASVSDALEHLQTEIDGLTPGAAIVLTSNLVPPWSGLATPLPADDTFVTLPQFVSGLNERNPFLVTSVVPTMGQGNGADAALFGNGGAPQSVLVQTDLALQVTFTSGVGQVGITAALFDELDNELDEEGILCFPTTAIVRLVLNATVPLNAFGKVFLKFKKNDANATVVSGVNLLGCSTAVALVP
jgi:hypothetical protein